MSSVNLEKFVKDGEKYNKKIPFPHCISDRIWDKKLLENIETEINSFKDWDGERNFFGSVGKRYCSTKDKFQNNISKIIDISSSPEFIKCLERISGEEGLIPNPYLEGG